MANQFLNRGANNILDRAYRAGDSFALPLFTSATAPNATSTNTVGNMTEITVQGDYTTGGQALQGNSTDFDVLSEDDTNSRAFIQLKDVSNTGVSGVRYVGLSTGTTTTVTARDLEHVWDLGSDKTVSSGQSLTFQDLEIRINV